MNNKHIEWWQLIPVIDRFSLMKKYEVKKVNDKLIKKMWRSEMSNTT